MLASYILWRATQTTRTEPNCRDKSQKKKWAGHDRKQLRHHNLKEARGKATKSGKWNERASSAHLREAKKFRKAKKVAAKSLSSQTEKRQKNKKKKQKQEEANI